MQTWLSCYQAGEHIHTKSMHVPFTRTVQDVKWKKELRLTTYNNSYLLAKEEKKKARYFAKCHILTSRKACDCVLFISLDQGD